MRNFKYISITIALFVLTVSTHAKSVSCPASGSDNSTLWHSTYYPNTITDRDGTHEANTLECIYYYDSSRRKRMTADYKYQRCQAPMDNNWTENGPNQKRCNREDSCVLECSGDRIKID
ncbi:MAG TPA: hypothetical protein VKR58_08825 [Aquella sp.]|nr:hypothetical protein [Aquella sp.]